jgi:hypothetical protein
MIYSKPATYKPDCVEKTDCAAGSQAGLNCRAGQHPGRSCSQGSQPWTPGRCALGQRAGEWCYIGCEPMLGD